MAMSALIAGAAAAVVLLKKRGGGAGAGGIVKDLSKLHPSTAAKVRQVLEHMRARGTPFAVAETLRTRERQAQLYAQGRNGNPGNIVTHKSGEPGHESEHQAKRDGRGRAADLVIDPKGWRLSSPAPTWAYDVGVDGGRVVRPEVLAAWKEMGRYAMSLGLRWLGTGRNVDSVSGLAFDPPHIEDTSV